MSTICDDCKYCDNDPDTKPCSVCLQWIEGYLEATEYVYKN